MSSLSVSPLSLPASSIVPPPYRDRFATARKAFCHDDVITAHPLFSELAAALPDNMEVQLYAAWSRARVAESFSDDDRDALEHLARVALGSQRSLAPPLCILGQAAMRRGELRVARRLFRRATEADTRTHFLSLQE